MYSSLNIYIVAFLANTNPDTGFVGFVLPKSLSGIMYLESGSFSVTADNNSGSLFPPLSDFRQYMYYAIYA